MGAKIATQLRIDNQTEWNITNTAVYNVVNYDWGSESRPDYNFVGVRIPAKSQQTRWADINQKASNCPFTMKLTFSDGTVDEFRIHQRYAVGCCPGYSHTIRSHDLTYGRRDGNMIVITVRNTQQQNQNLLAERKNKEGEMKMKQKKYEEAMKLFDEALKEANQSSTINTIKNNNSNACLQQGKEDLKKAFDFENNDKQDKSKEAQNMLNRAKTMFQKSQNFKSSSEAQNYINFVNLKVAGNQTFNQAVELEAQAFKLFEAATASNRAQDYDKAQSKYNEAKAKYQEALKKFEGGVKTDARINNSVKVAKECIEGVNGVIADLEKLELSAKIGKVEIEEKENEERIEEVNKDLQQQVDVTK